MKIELKAFQPAANMSQETLAFTASVYVDGKRVGEAFNEGTGGSTCVHADLEVDAEAVHSWMLENVDWWQAAYRPTTAGEALDALISELADRMVVAKRIKTHLRKWVLFRTPSHDGSTYGYYRCKPTPENVTKVRALLDREGEEYEIGSEAWLPETVADLEPVSA